MKLSKSINLNKSWIILIIFFLNHFGGTLAAIAENCKDNEPQQCASRADTLLKDPDLVLPDTSTSIDRVCRTWSDFTTCVYDYTKRCLTPQQKSQFERSFRDPVSSMRTLCEDTAFRREYLLYAPCIKKVSTEDKNCGHQYRFLIDHMSGSTTSVKQICCACAKFKKCVAEKTREKCDAEHLGGNLVNGHSVELNATAFAIQILEKSLSYVSQQCSVSSFSEEECPGIRENSKGPLESVPLQPSASDEIVHKQPPQQTFQIRPRKTTAPPKQEKLSDNSGNSQIPRFTGLYSHLFHLSSFSIFISLVFSKLLV